MKDWIKNRRIPLLFSAACLSLLLLIVFQINWLLTSQQLVEEQFDQKVNLVLGSALNHFNTSRANDLILDSSTCCAADKACYSLFTDDLYISLEEQDKLEETIADYMSCFGIADAYEFSIVDKQLIDKSSKKSYNCSVDPTNVQAEEVRLQVNFPCRSQYVFDKLKFMMISSILISMLLATVSFLILKALIQQKRTTENNIDFFNNTAHELKTPLTNISLALNLFNRKNKDVKDQKYLQIIKRESAKLTNQIERVLYLSKMESGEYILEKEEFDLREVVQQAVQYMDMIRAEKKGEINLDLPETSCVVKGDRFHLNNICINLVDNALKYCEQNPIINISLRQEADTFKLIFSDNGIGISKYDQEHIFEKFQRVSTGDIQNVKGFGIGLSYVKTVLEMHKGFIKVQSELNKGTQFEISIPGN